MASGSSAEFGPDIPNNAVALFNEVVKNNERLIDENQLKTAIDRLFYVSFNIRTVRLLIHHVTSDCHLIIGPNDYAKVYRELKLVHGPFQSLKETNGLIKPSKAQQGLASVGTKVSKDVFSLLIYNFTTRGSVDAITFGNFVECRITIEGLKRKYYNVIKKGPSWFDENEFNNFMLAILPFIIS